LVRGFRLSKKFGKTAWIEPVVNRAAKEYHYRVRTGTPSPSEKKAIEAGTKLGRGCKFRCLLSDEPIPEDHIKRASTRGELKAEVMAIVAEGDGERLYLSPDAMAPIEVDCPKDLRGIDAPLANDPRNLWCLGYGLDTFDKLFTPRQLVTLTAYSDLVHEAHKLVLRDADRTRLLPDDSRPLRDGGRGPVAYADAIATYLALVASKASVFVTTLARWRPGEGKSAPAFGRQAIPMVWDFVDVNPFAGAVTPKAQELIASPYRHDGSWERAGDFFEAGLAESFTRIREAHLGFSPLSVYYAFKQAETDDSDEDEDGQATTSIASTGWETMLEGLVRAGFSITGTWPSRTEGGTRLTAMGTNALASSVVIACRPRPAESPLATRKEFMISLRRDLPEALRNLQQGNIAPVDLAQAAIGPGMAIFTRYAKVIESGGSTMTVRTALGIINQVLDEVLAEQEGEFDADSRLALAWFEQFGTDGGSFGVAETLSKAKNTAVSGLVEAGVVVAKAGKVRLLSRDDLPEDWDPATDRRLTVWEITQHLIRKLEQAGESATAALIHKLGGMAATARDLAYLLYNICERKKWADEALAYNGLVIAWPELAKLALAERSKAPEKQSEMF
jgi:adenine-specific DNA methylase